MTLPLAPSLAFNLLAQCFNDTSATYKFYWFLSILQQVEDGNFAPKKTDLFAGMISNAWYTVNYFHVSFGKQDKLQRAILEIKDKTQLFVDEPRHNIIKRLKNSSDKSIIRELNYFNQEVPWRFLSPWIKGKENDVYSFSKDFEQSCPYALHDHYVEINPAWIAYLQSNSGILKSFCYWKLSLYLQKHNPNVPDIPNKLIRPAKRNTLNEQRKFWNIVIAELGAVECIYSNKKLEIGNFAVEHFIPYSFVSHDLMWNLIPANPAFNCSKGDKLPSLDLYFDDFFKLQFSAIEIFQHKAPKHKFLEDYLTIYTGLGKTNKLEFKKKYFEILQPLITIAANNGFSTMQ